MRNSPLGRDGREAGGAGSVDSVSSEGSRRRVPKLMFICSLQDKYKQNEGRLSHLQLSICKQRDWCSQKGSVALSMKLLTRR